MRSQWMFFRKQTTHRIAAKTGAAPSGLPTERPNRSACRRSSKKRSSIPPYRLRLQSLAHGLVAKMRAERGYAFGVEALMKEFALSTPEGMALMCLAKSLLRIPDDETRDVLIRDKLPRATGERMSARAGPGS